MRIVFVRHGEPDYEHDCLTETGRKQAAAAAARLERENITEIYSSPMGRARETAGFTAERLQLPVTVLNFMHEISWGGPDIPDGGHPWTLSSRMMAGEGFDFYKEDWREHPYFKNNAATEYYDRVGACFDEFLASTQGYRQEGTRFFCTADKQKTIAVFSHGGSCGCVLARLLSLPFPYVTAVLPFEFTSIIILSFPVRVNEYVHPRIELFNDAAHTSGISRGLRFQEKP